jgi:hypothetical protein
MRNWAALVLSTLALTIALIGTPATDAAVHAVRLALFAKNAGEVNGIKASRTPKAGRLVPLNASQKLPASVVPRVDAASVNGILASQPPVPGMLVPLGTDGRFDPSVIPTIAARVSSVTDQAVPLSAPGANTPETSVVFNHVTFDSDHLYNPSAPDGLTIPVPGIYLVTATVRWASAPLDQFLGDRVVRLIADNNHGGNEIADAQADPPSGPAQTITSVYAFAAGDRVRVQVGSSTDTRLTTNNGDIPSLAVVWLAPVA